MGNGIAQVAARAGYDVVMRDISDDFLQRGMKAIDKSLQRDVDKERLAVEDKASVISRISTATSLDALKEAAIVIEAVTEDLKVKSEVFQTLDAMLPADAILASNTSSISITKLAAATKRAEQALAHPIQVRMRKVRRRRHEQHVRKELRLQRKAQLALDLRGDLAPSLALGRGPLHHTVEELVELDRALACRAERKARLDSNTAPIEGGTLVEPL